MDLFERMLELSGQGFYCAQILMILALESEEKEDPDLIRAMSGLNGGLGFSGRVCGALTGGCCFLGYFLGKGLNGEAGGHRSDRRDIAATILTNRNRDALDAAITKARVI